MGVVPGEGTGHPWRWQRRVPQVSAEEAILTEGSGSTVAPPAVGQGQGHPTLMVCRA